MSGSVRRPGLYELPLGVPLRELVELAGGVPRGRTLRAVLLGGACGAVVRPGGLDVPLTAGVVVLLDDTAEPPGPAMNVSAGARRMA